MPQFSIIIPVYRVEEYLEKCVDSILAQTCQDFELLLIDDGSPDGSGAICDRYAASHPNQVRALHQPNGGAGAARNRGIDCYNALRRREAVTLDDGLAETLGELAEFDRATTEAADLVGALVAAMTPPDRDIFLRKYYLLQSGKEIAAALGMSVESVNTRLSRGRDRLRRELTAKGVYSHA